MGSCLSNNDHPGVMRGVDDTKVVRVLMLGPAGSGKSTILKYMRVLHNDQFTPHEIESYRQQIFINIIRGVQILADSLPSMDLELSRENQRFVETLCETSDLGNGESYPGQLLQPLEKLWGDPGLQTGWLKINEVIVVDDLQYFFGDLPRFFQPDYLPTTEDILRCRNPTTGIIEMSFELPRHKLCLFEVGGRRSDRRQWIHCFVNVSTILFVVSLNSYDLSLIEDSNENQMRDAMNSWESICHSRYFGSTNIILFLNKNDLFTKKVKISPINQHFPDYEGSPGDAAEGRNYFREKFLKLSGRVDADDSSANEPSFQKRVVYLHYTDATDTSLLRVVLAAIEDTMVRQTESTI